MSNALHPAHHFRNVVESKASDFLQAMAGTEEGAKAAGRVALAFRQAAQTNDLLPRGKSLQWQVSHRGFSKLAARSGVRLRTKAVFESDTFHVIEGTEPKLEHVPDLSAEQSWDTLVAVYVVAHYKDGSKDFVVIRKADIEKRRANSDSYKRNKNQSPWGQWPIEMALKTGLRYAFARGIVTMDDTTTSAYEHDGIQDASTEDLNVVEMNDPPEVNTMNVLSDQLDELVQQTDKEESLLED